MQSPFPGMDPYLEDPALWPDVHNSLIVVARELLTQSLRPKYYVRIEERIYVSGDDDPGRPVLIPDLRVAERPEHAGMERPASPTDGVAIAEPETLVTLLDDEIHEPRMEVFDRETRQVVTVIELLSPSNKFPGSEGRRSYQEKRDEVLHSPCHWVEIDLLRTGAPIVPRVAPPYDYIVHLSRADKRPRGSIYRIFLPQRLPTIRIPLKGDDPDALLDLQRALEITYDRAGYDGMINYGKPPAVALSEKHAAWVDELLRSKGLR
jgi:hypothetical protein